MTTRNRELAGIIDDSGNITAGGNLTVSGTTLTASSTVETHADPLIELNTGAGSNSNDLGFVFERGSTGDNACLIWDESNDAFAVGTTSATGTSTGNMSYTVGDFLAGKVTVDSVLINGTTIGHTSDTDLLTLADGLLTVAGEISVTTLDIGGTNVTATAAELNILDGVNSTAAELNILDGVTATAAEINFLDGDTSATSTTLAAADRVIVNDGGTMKQVALSDFETFFESEIDTFSTIDINGGSIDGATVGAASASTGAFTTLAASGNTTLSGNLNVAGSINSSAVGVSKWYHATNSGNPEWYLGASDTNRHLIQAVYHSGAQTLERVAFRTETSHGGADAGYFSFEVDGGNQKLKIDDGGIEVTGTITGTLGTAAQTNITSLGTLSALTMSSGGVLTQTVGSSGGVYHAIGHSGNENWSWAAQSGSGSDDYLDVGIASGTRVMSWHEDGKVGIGTASPSKQLTISGADSEFLINRTGSYADTINMGMPSGVPTIVGGTDLAFGGTGTWTEHMRIKADGKVGIGAPAPATDLQIGDYSDNAETITIATASDQTGRINFYNNNASEGASMRVTGGGAGAKMYFANRYDADVDRVTFDLVNGNVGIGTTSPAQGLHLASGKQARFDDHVSIQPTKRLYIDGGGDTFIEETAANKMTFTTANAERMRIWDDGNVSIGATAAQNGKLHLADNKGSAGDLWTQVGPNNNMSLIIQNISTVDNTNAVLYFANDAGVQAAINARFVDHSTDETELRFSTHDGSNARERMTLDGDGKLGIGTTTPDGPLHVMQGSAGSVTASTDKNSLVVENSTHGGMSVLTPDAAEAGLFTGHPSANRCGEFHTRYDTKVLRLGTRGHASFKWYMYAGNWTNTLIMDTDALYPATDSAYDLGSNSLRFANIYINDLHLSNEGSQNDIDGTSGDWTIQEGEEHLYIKNNKSGKKYRFALEEIE